MNIKDAVKNKLNQSLESAQFRYAVILACLETFKGYEEKGVTLREAKKVVQHLEKEGYGECRVWKSTHSITTSWVFYSAKLKVEMDIGSNNYFKQGWSAMEPQYKDRLIHTNNYIQELAGTLNNFEAFFSTYENQEKERKELEDKQALEWQALKHMGDSFKHYYEQGNKAVQEWNRAEAWKEREKALGIR